MADRTIPEDFDPNKKKSLNGFQKRMPAVRSTALVRRMKGKMDAGKPTPHQQHLAHLQHMANVKNRPKQYGK